MLSAWPFLIAACTSFPTGRRCRRLQAQGRRGRALPLFNCMPAWPDVTATASPRFSYTKPRCAAGPVVYAARPALLSLPAFPSSTGSRCLFAASISGSLLILFAAFAFELSVEMLSIQPSRLPSPADASPMPESPAADCSREAFVLMMRMAGFTFHLPAAEGLSAVVCYVSADVSAAFRQARQTLWLWYGGHRPSSPGDCRCFNRVGPSKYPPRHLPERQFLPASARVHASHD